MKKRFVSILICFTTCLTILFSFASCKQDEPAPTNQISISSYSEGTIIRNTVVNLDTEDATYYEYLTFTSSTEGSYALYLKGESENTQILTFTNSSGESQAVPTTFTYDPSTGKFSTSSSSAYLFSCSDVNIIASDLMSAVENNSSLTQTWTTSNLLTFTLNSDGTVLITDSNNVTTNGTYTEDSGWVTIECGSKIPCFYTADSKLFYLAYKTERQQVQQVGRTMDSSLCFVSPVFLLLNK